MALKDQGEWALGTMNGVAKIKSFGETLQISLHCPCGCGKSWRFAGRWDDLPALQQQFEASFNKDLEGLKVNIVDLAVQAAAMNVAMDVGAPSAGPDTSVN